MLKPIICAIILFTSCVSFGQDKNYELEATYMNCMYGIFEDDGAELKELIKNAEQKLVAAKLLKDTSGESYIALFKNIEKAVDGRISSLGVSDHVIEGMSDKVKVKENMTCMQVMMKSENFEGSKLSKLIQLSSSGSSNPKITAITEKLLLIFEAKDFDHDFYKYLTFSLIDKFNTANKKQSNPPKGQN